MIDIRRGLEILKKNIRIAPEKPGVYRMLGEGGKVLFLHFGYVHFASLPMMLSTAALISEAALR